MRTTDISIIVCTYNRSEMLREALESLIKQQIEGVYYEIIIIDNGSTDDTASIVKDVAKYSDILIKYVYESLPSISYARNRGINESEGEWVAFFDDDQLAEPDWLKELFAVVIQKGVCCAGGALRLKFLGPQIIKVSSICRAILGEKITNNRLEKCNLSTFPGTGNILVKRSVFNSVGVFNESLSRGGEDTDLARRVLQGGYEAWLTPRAIVYHLVPPYRLKDNYLIWSSIRGGDRFAYRDYKQWGFMKTAFILFARAGQALLINVPSLIWASLKKDKIEALGRKCLLWKFIGYTRQCLFLFWPKGFPQREYFESLDFRNARNLFSDGSININNCSQAELNIKCDRE